VASTAGVGDAQCEGDDRAGLGGPDGPVGLARVTCCTGLGFNSFFFFSGLTLLLFHFVLPPNEFCSMWQLLVKLCSTILRCHKKSEAFIKFYAICF